MTALLPVVQVTLSRAYYAGRDIGTWAIKEGPPSVISPEAEALSRVHAAHDGCAPNVVPLGGVVAKPIIASPGLVCTGPVAAILLLPMSGCLGDWLKQPVTQLTSVERWHIIKQVISGLRAGQAAGVAHRDVKPENILHDQGQVYISDFGLSTCGATANTTSKVARGSPLYMAPEVLRCHTAEQQGSSCTPFNIFAADVYSLGVCLLSISLPRTWTAVLKWSECDPRHFDLLRSAAQQAAVRTYSSDQWMVRLMSRSLEPDHALRASLEELALIAEAGAAEARSQQTAAANAHNASHAAAALHAYTRGEPKPPHTTPAALPGDRHVWQEDQKMANLVYSSLVTSFAKIAAARLVVRPPSPHCRATTRPQHPSNFAVFVLCHNA